jgi:dienelactone hydrolase
MKLSSLVWLFLSTLAFALAAPLAAAKIESKRAVCEGKSFEYLLYRPAHSGPLPAVLLLHGAGDSARPMMDAWQSMAKKDGIVLIAPELPRKAEFEEMAPRVFHCVVLDAKQFAALDPKRLYVFGNSMGGYLAYDAAAFQSDYFAAVGVHAMGIDPHYDHILDNAKRKIPIAIYMGDRDPLVSLSNVRRTRALLEKNGFPVHYTELKNHDHNYYWVADKVNPDVWQFFSAQRLP